MIKEPLAGKYSTTISGVLFLHLALWLLAVGSLSAAKNKKSLPPPSLQKTFSPSQLKEDLKVLREALEEGHPGLYLYTPKEDFDRHFERAEEALDRAMTLREFYLKVTPLVEKVYCGHTYFDLPQKLLNSLLKDAPQFPLPLVFLNQKAYLDHAALELPLGCEITAIDGIPMEAVMQKLLPQARSDGYNETMKYHILANDFGLRHFLSFGPAQNYRVDYLPYGSEETLQKQISAIPAKKLEGRLTQRHSESPKRKKYKIGAVEKGISLFSMNTFDLGLNKKGRRKYKDFLRENFSELEQDEDARCIILDLRKNDGGFVGNDAQLFAYLAQAPFRDFRSARMTTLEIPVKDHLSRHQFPKMLEKIFAKEFKSLKTGKFTMSTKRIAAGHPRKTPSTDRYSSSSADGLTPEARFWEATCSTTTTSPSSVRKLGADTPSSRPETWCSTTCPIRFASWKSHSFSMKTSRDREVSRKEAGFDPTTRLRKARKTLLQTKIR